MVFGLTNSPISLSQRCFIRVAHSRAKMKAKEAAVDPAQTLRCEATAAGPGGDGSTPGLPPRDRWCHTCGCVAGGGHTWMVVTHCHAQRKAGTRGWRQRVDQPCRPSPSAADGVSARGSSSSSFQRMWHLESALACR